MAKNKPVIGITRAPDKGFTLQFFMLQLSVFIAGGKPATLKVYEEEKARRIDGLLIGGGRDVYPAMYQQEAIPGNPYNRVQDDMESKWLYWAMKYNLPVMAICRGAQLMNVVKGGTIYHNLTAIFENADYPHSIWSYNFFRKKIHITTDSLLYKITGKDEIYVNSIHKRAIDKVGTGLKVTSREPNGIIQSIEDPSHRFFIGMQFHPERLLYLKKFRKIFRFFVKTAGKEF
ncbi:MAG: gamma-glutamyl-gamma-aminobutyrate hydrolase family protein [Bacteroidales bacterium]